jgi:hypothetical protein
LETHGIIKALKYLKVLMEKSKPVDFASEPEISVNQVSETG